MEDILNQLLEELPHNRYDIVSKHIFGTFTEDLLRALTKIPGLKFLEQLETELPTVEIRRMDVLAKTLVEEQEVLVHIEFQVSRETRAEIIQRKVGYLGRCFERYGLPILSYIIYLSPDAGQNDPGGYSQAFPGHKIEIEYQVIRLSELEGQSIFETRQTSLMAFAPLMRPRAGVSAVEWVEECHQITRALSLEPELQQDLLLWQWILNGLIVDPADIQHLMEGPMLESSTYRYILQQGIEQGIEQGKKQYAVEAILTVLDVRFETDVAEKLRPFLGTIDDLQRLDQLHRVAAQASSIDEFTHALLNLEN